MSAPTAHSPSSDSSRPHASSSFSAPAWRAFVHLYLPILTSAFFILTIPNPFEHRALLLASALPTYFFGSLIHQPRPPPTGRFTRRSDLHRAAVLFTYGRLLGTPFNLWSFISDLLSSYGVGAILDRPDSAPPRRSEFFVQALLTGASTLVFGFIPPRWGLIWTFMGGIDRTMFRAAYLALVDDVVYVLAYPESETKRGKAVVMVVQAVFIAVSVMWVHFVFVYGARAQLQRELVLPTDV